MQYRLEGDGSSGLYFSCLMKVITASSIKILNNFEQCMSEYRAGANIDIDLGYVISYRDYFMS